MCIAVLCLVHRVKRCCPLLLGFFTPATAPVADTEQNPVEKVNIRYKGRYTCLNVQSILQLWLDDFGLH